MKTTLAERRRDEYSTGEPLRVGQVVPWMCSQAHGQSFLYIAHVEAAVRSIGAPEGNSTDADTSKSLSESVRQILEDELGRKCVTFQVGDTTPLPFDDAAFDTIFIGDLLEHLAHPAEAIAQAYRMLRNTGRLVMVVRCGLSDGHQNYIYYPTSIVELVQSSFRTCSLGISEDYIQYVGVKESGYCFAEVPADSLLQQCLQIEKDLEAFCFEKERSLVQIHAQLKQQLSQEAAWQERIAQKERLHAARLRESERYFQEVLAKREAEWLRKTANGRLRAMIRAALPADARVLVISNGDDDLIQLDGRHAMHFPQMADGVYAGHHPKDAAEAISHLEMLKAKGAAYLLIPATSLWWLEFYEEFRRYLEAHGSLVLFEADTCVVYALGPPTGGRSFACEIGIQQAQAAPTVPQTPPLSGVETRPEVAFPEAATASARCSSDPTLAVILDEFTSDCLQPECNLLKLRTEQWQETLEQNRPDAVFIESAWSGNGGAWHNRLANLRSRVDHDLQDMLQWARQRSIPSIFWNKEDPVHFDRFIDTARLFSHVFTTDSGCIPQYQQQLGHDRVFALPFAAQPAIHHPVQSEPREGSVCFAGTYYGSHHAVRQADMEHILRPAIPFGLEIYDRQYGVSGKGADYAFPEIYQPCIKGRLDYEEMVRAYKRYRVFLNVNSVKHSSTMFSRRVFELLACGTPVISTYSAGIVELLGEDVVFISETEDDTRRHLEHLLGDEQRWARASVRGIRKVHGEHTYRHRLQEVFERVGLTLPAPAAPQISILVRANSASEVKRLATMLSGQTYRQFDVVLLSETPLPAHAFEVLINVLPDVQIFPLVGSADVVWEACLSASTAEYVAFLDVRDWYGPNYLMDYSIAIMYSHADLIGKHTYYDANGYGEPQLNQLGHEFRYVASVPTGSFIARKAAVRSELFEQAASRPIVQTGEHLILSIDRFNYLHDASVCNKTDGRRDKESLEIQTVYV